MVFCGFPGRNRVSNLHLDRPFKRRLLLDRRIQIYFIVIPKVLLIHPLKLLCNVHIPVEIDVGIARMIVFPVKIKILLVGQIRDALRIAARLISVIRVREQ